MMLRTPGLRRRLALGVPALVLAGIGCGGEPSLQPPEAYPLLNTTVVSEPTSVSPATPAAGVAYVSLPPGAYPDGVSVSIVNPANGNQGGTLMLSGGWDPVAIAADPGDSLRIMITTIDNTTIEYPYFVPPTRSPTILRTEPPVRKRDVPLNSVIVVVFSEPIDPATVTSQRVQLLHNGQPVAADIDIAPDGLRMTVRPLAALTVNTGYVLAVSQEIADLSGDRLPQSTVVDFNTVESFPAGELAFVRGVEIIKSATDGSNPVTLVQNGSRPSWSPDGSRLAFTRPADNSLESWQLCIARSDGSDLRCATGATGPDIQGGRIVGGPSWSPDGETIAFSAFIYSCPDGDCGQFGGYWTSLLLLHTSSMQVDSLPTPAGVVSASWSPDGRKIALVMYGGSMGSGSLASVNADGTGFQILAESFGSYKANEVTWSPDGATLALRLTDENACPWYCDTAIGIVNADATNLRILDKARNTDQEYFWTRPEWSPDGRYLAYTITHGGSCYLHDLGCNDLAVVEVSSARVSRLLANGAYPSWRPSVGSIRR